MEKQLCICDFFRCSCLYVLSDVVFMLLLLDNAFFLGWLENTKRSPFKETVLFDYLIMRI